MGETYKNDKQAKLFLQFIADDCRNQLVNLLQGCRFFSVMCDGATDSGSIEEEIIYLRFLIGGKPTTKFLSLDPIAKADAAGIFSAIVESLEGLALDSEEWKHRLVGFGADGAAVLMGHRGGVAAKIKEVAPHVIDMHCCAHRLELAIKNSASVNPYVGIMDDLLGCLYKLYHYSPVCWHGLQEAGRALGVRVLKPVNILGTRWVAHRNRASKVVHDNWKVLVTHLEQVAQEGGNRERVHKAKGLLKRLLSARFLLYLNFSGSFMTK